MSKASLQHYLDKVIITVMIMDAKKKSTNKAYSTDFCKTVSCYTRNTLLWVPTGSVYCGYIEVFKQKRINFFRIMFTSSFSKGHFVQISILNDSLGQQPLKIPPYKITKYNFGTSFFFFLPRLKPSRKWHYTSYSWKTLSDICCLQPDEGVLFGFFLEDFLDKSQTFKIQTGGLCNC